MRYRHGRSEYRFNAARRLGRAGLISASFPRELRRLRARSKRAGRRHVRRRRLGFLRRVRGGRRGRRRGSARQRRRPGVRPERTGGRQGRAFCRARARPGLWPSSRRHRRRVRLLGGVAPERPRLARLRLDWLPRLGGEARPLERLAGRHGLAWRLRRARPAGRRAQFDLARRRRIWGCGPRSRWAFVRPRRLFVVAVYRWALHLLMRLASCFACFCKFWRIFTRTSCCERSAGLMRCSYTSNARKQFFKPLRTSILLMRGIDGRAKSRDVQFSGSPPE